MKDLNLELAYQKKMRRKYASVFLVLLLVVFVYPVLDYVGIELPLFFKTALMIITVIAMVIATFFSMFYSEHDFKVFLVKTIISGKARYDEVFNDNDDYRYQCGD